MMAAVVVDLWRERSEMRKLGRADFTKFGGQSMRAPALLFVIALFHLPLAVGASPASYKCSVKQSYQLGPDGELILNSGGDGKSSVGEFMVDRIRGAIVGDSLQNSTATTVQVVHPGDTKMSFRVVSYYRKPGLAEYLEIREYRPGPSKPFIGIGLVGLVVGTCE